MSITSSWLQAVRRPLARIPCEEYFRLHRKAPHIIPGSLESLPPDCCDPNQGKNDRWKRKCHRAVIMYSSLHIDIFRAKIDADIQ
ncbi:hypothetical protein CSA56_07545 [candidate division KSB3 bacterium]|uniref:Uncharacterized protein n=1 Tax=candidate division KSB3 bacterium TaxID=2044937 RepID=A0A2G6KFS2_9BACT|nr:MAG: hypothetical protein CSA56_07545 [candidate division KSB3 bacterium]